MLESREMRSSFWNQPAIRSETMGSPSLSASHQAILKQARLLGRRGPAQPSVPQKAWSTNLHMDPFHSSKNLDCSCSKALTKWIQMDLIEHPGFASESQLRYNHWLECIRKLQGPPPASSRYRCSNSMLVSCAMSAQQSLRTSLNSSDSCAAETECREDSDSMHHYTTVSVHKPEEFFNGPCTALSVAAKGSNSAANSKFPIRDPAICPETGAHLLLLQLSQLVLSLHDKQKAPSAGLSAHPQRAGLPQSP